jgi:hypothetical protein
MRPNLSTLPAIPLLRRLDDDRRRREFRTRIAARAFDTLAYVGAIIAILFVLALVAIGFAKSAHASDAIDIRQGATTTHYEGTLLSRDEDGPRGSIEFGARTSHTIPTHPIASVPSLDGDYDVEIHPANGSGGFSAEHCQRGTAAYRHVSGSTYLFLVCPATSVP